MRILVMTIESTPPLSETHTTRGPVAERRDFRNVSMVRTNLFVGMSLSSAVNISRSKIWPVV
jgi:hypothetical protein